MWSLMVLMIQKREKGTFLNCDCRKAKLIRNSGKNYSEMKTEIIKFVQ
jgi:hypothetical protein